MAEAKYTEGVGYRANATKPDDKRKEIKNGIITVYAERTNNQTALGEYGGDAFPAVYEKEVGNYTYGMIIAADGVGQAAYPHPSLEKSLSEKIASFCAELNNSDEAKLSLFLRTLYGDEIFKDNNKDALDYALKSFAPAPTDGFYVSDKAKWSLPTSQKVMPFYERESQWLSSRIVCVGLYFKFREYFASGNGRAITNAAAAELKKEIEQYIYGELKDNIFKLIDPERSDIEGAEKKARYFLCSTVAMWFYIYNKTTAKISALALNMGDARCYVSDKEDGVRQISVDDAFSDGSMSAFVHFGTTPKTGNGYYDGSFRARLVSTDAPCALFACSDGVYDTCPEVKTKVSGEHPLGSEQADVVDFLFEKNLLDAMRRCYSLDDFTREIVFTFYGQAKSSKGIAERNNVEYYPGVKRDDSGTLGAKFFGKQPAANQNSQGQSAPNPNELFDELRSSTTTLDKLYNKVLELKAKGVEIPISEPHVSTQAQLNQEKIAGLANRLFTADFIALVKELYDPAYDDKEKAGSPTLWGMEIAKREAGFALNQRIKTAGFRTAVLTTAASDWKAIEGGQKRNLLSEWADNKHEHIIVNDKVFTFLNKSKFGDIVNELYEKTETSGGSDAEAEKYESFEKCFMGEVGKREDVDTVDKRADASTLDKYAPQEKPAAKVEKSPEQAILDGDVKTRTANTEVSGQGVNEQQDRDSDIIVGKPVDKN